MASKQAKQFNLFEEDSTQKQPKIKTKIEEPIKLNALKLSKNDTKKESKLKKLISSRLKKIEKLNSLLEKDKSTLYTIKDLYHKNLSEDIENLCKEIENYTVQLVKRYGQKNFANYQREVLEYLIEENFDELYSKDYMSDTVDDLIKTYNGLKEEYYGFDEEEEDEIWNDIFGDEFDEKESEEDDFMKETGDNFAKELIREMLRDMGLEVDDDFFEGLDPNDPDFEEKFQERLFEYSENHKSAEKAEANRKKVITTDKEFTKLYKSLVKKIHPDLTTDEIERKRREIIMKELSHVWEQRDYYQLMLLQAKIDPDFNGGMELNNNHLQQIADELLEKSKQIEVERFQLKSHPENEFYFKNFYASSDRKVMLFIENYKQKIKKDKKEIGNNFRKLKTQKTTKAFLKAVNDRLEEESLNDFWY